jgi:hypothetical protein
MDREQIIRMAREAGLAYGSDEKPLNSVTRFAALVAAAEREACVKVCDERITNEAGMQREDYENRQCAAAIRARGEQ